ncbi:hypothetical protein HDC94_002066 [Leifsonia sp. AK011]|uniref:hypothetical protein n=1 Tax=Leifsonia sp. AK011 TaxID=2723075 RepID=UPI0015CDE612|nr:hypothetical protein [Leifsonia sp. AK011]NYF10910.1 hypothetical protein [Leifsonia sp. AK011]
MTTRRLHVLAEVVLGAQAVALALLNATTEPIRMPVTAGFLGGDTLASVDLRVATVVLLGFSALCSAVAVRWPSRQLRWIEWSQVSAIIVFLVAQLNGVQDVAALVALYALTAGASLFLVSHETSKEGTWPFVFGAAVGIVPWGVIALYQVGPIIAGGEPTAAVRVITLAMLVLAAAYWFVMRRARVLERPILAERGHTVIVLFGVSLLASATFLFV